MEVSPKSLREVEFREKMRGYHPEDVDHFLEQVAAGIEVLQDRLRTAVDRAQRAEAAASEASGTDDTLRKTLVLAQRTADLAVQEAREQASRILASAEQQAQSMLTDAEERGRQALDDTIAESKAELSRLEATRSQVQQGVDGLQRWLDEHKAHLHASLSDAVAAVERAGVLWPAPTTRPLESLSRPSTASTSSPPAQSLTPAPTTSDPGGPGPESDQPPTTMWSPTEEDRLQVGEPVGDPEIPSSRPPASRYEPADPSMGLGNDEQALDDFFDDNDELTDDRRLSGRLRRRR